MVLRLIERGEVVEIGLDLGTVGHLETDRAKQLLHALKGARRGVQSAACEATPGKRHIERLSGELGVELGGRERFAAGDTRRLDTVFGGVDACALLAPGLRRKPGEALHRLGERAGLAEGARFDSLELGRVARAAEFG